MQVNVASEVFFNSQNSRQLWGRCFKDGCNGCSDSGLQKWWGGVALGIHMVCIWKLESNPKISIETTVGGALGSMQLMSFIGVPILLNGYALRVKLECVELWEWIC